MPAKVESIELLKMFRRALIKFAESANVAVTDSESEMSRLLMWIQTEQLTYWQMQIRKRTDWVGRCEEALRMKKLFVDAAGRRSSAIDEQKALEKAKRSLEIAHEKLANTKSWSRKLEREVQNYKGVVQRFATTVQSDLPVAAAKIESAILKLEEYFRLVAPTEATSAPVGGDSSVGDSSGAPGAGSVDALPSVTRAEPAEVPVDAVKEELASLPTDEKQGDPN